MKTAIVSTLKCSLKNTLDFAHYHLNNGFDHLFLFFDDPDDGAIEQLENNPYITCVRCTTQHWDALDLLAKSPIEKRQIRNADLALSWCREQGIDWISHIDSDELIYFQNSETKVALGSLPDEIDYLHLPTREAIPRSFDLPEHQSPFLETSVFKKLVPNQILMRDEELKDKVLFLNEYFRGHVGGKSITRVSDRISHLQIHRPVGIDGQKLIEKERDDAVLLHFDGFDFTHWLAKWTRRYDGTARFTGRENRNRQFDEFVVAYESNDPSRLRALYQQLYLLNDDLIDQLIGKDYACRIDIDPALFQLPA